MSKKKKMRKDKLQSNEAQDGVFYLDDLEDMEEESVLDDEEDIEYLDDEDIEEDIEYLDEEDFEEDVLEELDEDEEEVGVKKKKHRKSNLSNKKKAWIIAGSIVGGLVIIYLGISVFFMSHFYINTEINGHDFSAKTAKDVESYMKEQVKDYTLIILEKDQKKDMILGSDISLQYKENNDIKDALKKQNAFLWPVAFFEKSSTEVTIEVGYDEDVLNQKIENLQSVKAEQIPATNAYPKYNGTKFVVEPEVIGTAVKMETLQEKIHEYISGFKAELNMEKEGCYALPKYTSDSEEVKKACDVMNQYLKASITYTMDENVVVDKDLISTWLTVDDNMQVTFNETGVKDWMTAFGDKYDTLGGTRTITTPWGKTAEVSGGDYGWSIDEETEFNALVNSIKNGEVVTKEPAYYNGGRAASHGPQDWGTTYLEVDLSAQHMWFIVDGAVALESDVITGEPIPAKQTTPGVWFVKEMQQNKTLVGEIQPDTGKPEYETPVSYWMRITWSGIGFHDATWQTGFGGTLYQIPGVGSHGCINMPYDKAATLYGMLSMGTPAVVHY